MGGKVGKSVEKWEKNRWEHGEKGRKKIGGKFGKLGKKTGGKLGKNINGKRENGWKINQKLGKMGEKSMGNPWEMGKNRTKIYGKWGKMGKKTPQEIHGKRSFLGVLEPQRKEVENPRFLGDPGRMAKTR